MSDPIELDHLSDREILILTARGVNELHENQRHLHRRVRKLENWRTAIVTAYAVLMALVYGAWEFVKFRFGGNQ